MFTPEAASLIFTFLLLFFINLSFRLKNLVNVFIAVYFWRAAIEVVNRVYNLIMQTYFIGSTGDLADAAANPAFLFLEQSNLVYLKLAVGVMIFIGFYLFSSQVLRPVNLNFPWLLNFLISLALAGFALSSFLYLFSFEWNFYDNSLWDKYFLPPQTQLIWFCLPVVLVILADLISQKFFKAVLRKVLIIKK